MTQSTWPQVRPITVFRNALHWSVGLVLLGSLIVVVVVNLFFQRFLPADPSARVIRLQQAGLYSQAETVLKGMVDADPLNLDLNYQYINSHFVTFAGAQNDTSIRSYYLGLTSRAATADLGHYGLGLIDSLEKHYPAALQEYLLVANHDQKYLNNSIGRIYMQGGDDAKAATFLQREIALRGNVGGAVSNLATLYIKDRQVNRIRGLVDDPVTGPYVSEGVRRYLALETGDVLGYGQLAFLSRLVQISPFGVVSALLICAMWFLYFWRIDVFEQEPISIMLAVLLMGAASAFVEVLPSDILGQLLPVNIDPSWPQQLLFAVVNIGIVEELAKFTPVLLIALFSKQINEPIDLLIYGGLSALGFATLENTMYFTDYGLGIVFGRFLSATVMHLAMTGLVCYAWARARYLKPGNQLLAVLGGLLLAAIIHGLYDYFILGALGELSFLSLAIMILMAWVYSRMISRCLSRSPFFDQQRATLRRLLNYNLLASTAMLMLLIAYIYNAFTFSTEIANSRLLPVSFGVLIAIFVFLKSLGGLKLKPAQALAVR